MAKATEATPAEPETPDPETPDEVKAARERKSVFADERLLATNQIVRILNDLEPAERRAVMQIVNILVETPAPPTKESE